MVIRGFGQTIVKLHADQSLHRCQVTTNPSEFRPHLASKGTFSLLTTPEVEQG